MARGTSIILPLALLLLASSALSQQQLRRVRVRARPIASQEEPLAEARSAEAAPQVQYYAVQPQDEIEEPEALVVVQQPQQPRTRANAYQVARGDDEYRPQVRPQARATAAQIAPRTKESRPPPVQTIRNYNTINDDGSFTFGYEAADGSFKEETRGTDCVVRGKYGYIDPDGNKREFTYVSGNPCDPNNPDPDEDERELEDDSEENVPLRPQRPLRPVPTTRTRPATAANVPSQAVFQNNYIGDRIQPQAKAVPQAQIPITPRPVTHLRATLPPATTYRPQIQNYPAVTTPRPLTPQNVFYTAAPAQPTPIARRPNAVQHTTASSIDFDAELKKFQLEAGAPTLRPTTVAVKSHPATQNAIHTTQFVPRPTVPSTPLRSQAQPTVPAGNQFYSSQLVYDPNSGQYNNVLYQNLPKGGGDFSLNHRLQAFVQPPPQQPQQSVFLNPQSNFQHSFPSPRPAAPQASPSASPAAPQYVTPSPPQYSQPFARPGGLSPHAPQQSFYYINPNLRNQYSTGQIDDFLRGHNIQF